MQIKNLHKLFELVFLHKFKELESLFKIEFCNTKYSNKLMLQIEYKQGVRTIKQREDYVDVSEIVCANKAKSMTTYLKTTRISTILAELKDELGKEAYIAEKSAGEKRKRHFFHFEALTYFMNDWGVDCERLMPQEWRIMLPIRKENFNEKLVLHIDKKSGMIDAQHLITAHGGKFNEWLDHLKYQKTLEVYYKKQTKHEAEMPWDELKNIYIKKLRCTFWVDSVIFQNALYFCNINYQIYTSEIMDLYRRDPLKLAAIAVNEYDRQNGVKSAVLISSTDNAKIYEEELSKMRNAVEAATAEAASAKATIRLLEDSKFSVCMEKGYLDNELVSVKLDNEYLKKECIILQRFRSKLPESLTLETALESLESSIGHLNAKYKPEIQGLEQKIEHLEAELMELRGANRELIRCQDIAKFDNHLEKQHTAKPAKKKKQIIPPRVGDTRAFVSVYYTKGDVVIVDIGEASCAKGVKISTIYEVNTEATTLLKNLADIIGEHEIAEGAYVFTVGIGENMEKKSSCEEVIEDVYKASIKKIIKIGPR